MQPGQIKSVAIIGCGPAGAISIDALVQEGVFDKIRVFERREKAGGCWIEDPDDTEHKLPDFAKLANRTADPPLDVPEVLPAWTPASTQYRFAETSIYPLLETNIAAEAMEFSQEPMPDKRSAWSIQRHGADTPFRPHAVVQSYIESLVDRNGYEQIIECDTTVERVQKSSGVTGWRLTLRKAYPDRQQDHWWTEDFDAVLVASGHYTVPFVPYIEGLAEFAERYPGSVEHTKSFRHPQKYADKRVVTVGASISGPDTAVALAGVVETPLHAVVRGRYHPYFGDWAFRNLLIQRHGPISRLVSEDGQRTVLFEDGTSLSNVDHIILGTGYSWTMPFYPDMTVRNNRIPGLYLHIFPNAEAEAGMVFVGAVAAGFTFKVFEWQAVLAARYLAGRVELPSLDEREKWEQDRIAEKGDGTAFTALYPGFEEYFEQVRSLAGEPHERKGRPLPQFEKQWRENFDKAHLRRIAMWQRLNAEAEKKLRREQDSGKEVEFVGSRL